MAEVREGSESALAELMGRHQSRVYQFLLKHTGDADQAQELSQEVFVRLWKGSHTYKPQGRFSAYLYRMVLNVGREADRRLKREARADRAGHEVGPRLVEPTEDSLIRREEQRRVQRSIHRLPVKLKDALLLRYESELSYAEMAEVLGVSENALRSRIFHALKKLRTWMNKGGQA